MDVFGYLKILPFLSTQTLTTELRYLSVQMLVMNLVLKMCFVCSGKSLFFFFLNCILRLACVISVCVGFCACFPGVVLHVQL